ncbi:MAG TPA: hypothetical protein VF179_02025, partial [Thermoanaerobaculia bacterium]|nr:hypothetical protein [Thermoanaerobaculia bacterium]
APQMPHHRKICLQGREVSGLASVLGWLLEERGWSDSEMARRCRLEAESLHGSHPGKGFNHVYEGSADKTRNRLASILLGRLGAKRRGASEEINWDRIAKQIFEDELEVYAEVLGAHLLWLRCAGTSDGPIEWEPKSEYNRPEQIALLLRVYEKLALDVYVYSRFVPFELMPEEFLHAFFEAVFQNTTAFRGRSELFKLIYIGNERRIELQRPGRPKTASFTSVMLLPDLKELAAGKGLYRHINKDLRVEALNGLHSAVANGVKNLTIVVDEGAKASEVFEMLSGRRSLTVCGDVLSLEYDDKWGVRYWPGRSVATVQNARLAKSVIKEAQHNSPERVERVLDRLLMTSKHS